MTKTFAIAIAIASFAGFAAIVPAQAATRAVDINVPLFADRCADQGGAFADANPSFACETPDTVVVCVFSSLNTADCEWAGIDNQIAVNRIIGMADAVVLNDGSGPVVKSGGGFKKPDFPIKWK